MNTKENSEFKIRLKKYIRCISFRYTSTEHKLTLKKSFECLRKFKACVLSYKQKNIQKGLQIHKEKTSTVAQFNLILTQVKKKH